MKEYMEMNYRCKKDKTEVSKPIKLQIKENSKKTKKYKK